MSKDKIHADACADKIVAHWKAQGYPTIKVTVEPASFNGPNRSESLWVIKSNIGPLGFPPEGEST
jgi:hypothetical protein